MNPIHDKRIAIIGGGPGGLTLARLLQQAGGNVVVYERDVHRGVRVQGATLDLHEESGLAALEKAGLMPAFEANYRPGADLMRVVDKHAGIRIDEHGDDGNAYPSRRPEIDRGPLRAILLDSLATGTVIWDRRFVSMEPAGKGWVLRFEDGHSAEADIVIAADGANSRIRPYVTEIRAFYAGVTGVEGSIYESERSAPVMHELLRGGKVFALGDGKVLILSSKGDGSLVFYMSFNSDEYWWRDGGVDFSDRSSVKCWFHKAFTGWDPVWEELLDKASLPLVVRPMYCMPLDQEWEAMPNLTMLGDAAHLMPPYAGEGVNMAMLDALELSGCLLDSGFLDVRSAIEAYETRMRARASATAEMTMAQTAALHSDSGLDNMLSMFGQV